IQCSPALQPVSTGPSEPFWRTAAVLAEGQLSVASPQAPVPVATAAPCVAAATSSLSATATAAPSHPATVTAAAAPYRTGTQQHQPLFYLWTTWTPGQQLPQERTSSDAEPTESSGWTAPSPSSLEPATWKSAPHDC